jgi:DNA-binding MarR family transcriptional regulator
MRALLDAIALAWNQGQPMSVREAISLKKLGSAATLHKRLSILRSEGYLEELNTQGDKRTKLLGLTPKTLLYFETLGALLALQQSSSFKVHPEL